MEVVTPSFHRNPVDVATMSNVFFGLFELGLKSLHPANAIPEPSLGDDLRHTHHGTWWAADNGRGLVLQNDACHLGLIPRLAEVPAVNQVERIPWGESAFPHRLE